MIFKKMMFSNNINSTDAFSILNSEDESYLIDVRTIAEWSFVGLPDLSKIGKDTKLISWLTYPTMEKNESFLEQLEKEVANKNAKIKMLMAIEEI